MLQVDLPVPELSLDITVVLYNNNTHAAHFYSNIRLVLDAEDIIETPSPSTSSSSTTTSDMEGADENENGEVNEDTEESLPEDSMVNETDASNASPSSAAPSSPGEEEDNNQSGDISTETDSINNPEEASGATTCYHCWQQLASTICIAGLATIVAVSMAY
jgi:DNA mismatch repair ATPase MutL